MLANLPALETEPLWDLIRQYKEDPRDNKIDLVIGVYRDQTGQTPVFNIVQQAEQWLANQGQSKSYKPLSGNAQFNQQITDFLLSSALSSRHPHCTIQTVGGTGALRVLGEFIARICPQAIVWNTDPGYINHQPIMEAAGLTVKSFRWQQKEGGLDIESCFADLANARRGDVLLLHGCCHNPSGIDPSFSQWQALATFCKNTGVIPLIDMAYQGFSEDTDADAAGLRWLIKQLGLVLIASSCSKNMGLYCERIGAASIVTTNTDRLSDARILLEHIARASYSMPPDHGAAVASFVFDHPQQWLQELSICRQRVVSIRQQLGEQLAQLGAHSDLSALAHQKGMFSLLPFNPEQMQQLREKYAICGTNNGRINIAGLRSEQIHTLASALMHISTALPAHQRGQRSA